MRTKIRKMGNSFGVIIPKPIFARLGVQAGDELDLSLDDGRLLLSATRRHPRAGWAEAANA